jgi:hypothetical protein
MAFHVMAVLAKERYPLDQKPRMVAPMNLVAVQAVLGNGHMLKCKGSSLFGVAFVTKLVY